MTVVTAGASVFERLQLAWARSDRIFALLDDDAWLQRPIPLRHPFLFYFGHLPAFAWNQVAVGVLGMASEHAEFDELFERGIDPAESSSEQDAWQAPPSSRWPPRESVRAYRDSIRLALPGLQQAAEARDPRVFHVVLEHELMHHETLLYMVQQLEPQAARATPDVLPDDACLVASLPPAPEVMSIPAGVARLGAPASAGFGWDNEFPAHQVEVQAFELDRYPVTNARFLAFVESGGYASEAWWDPAAWARLAASGRQQPLGWIGKGDERRCRTLFGDVPWRLAAAWPVLVSADEADAYARWEGRRLPTEAEWHHAAFGTLDGAAPRWPWGSAAPEARRGNFGFHHWAPTPVDSHPAGASAFGVEDLLGNAWEWTASTFEPLPGFRATLPHYPGYSADFFDGAHRVVLGGSWATDLELLRPSFRNWFRPEYPYAFTGFRLAGPPRSGT